MKTLFNMRSSEGPARSQSRQELPDMPHFPSPGRFILT